MTSSMMRPSRTSPDGELLETHDPAVLPDAERPRVRRASRVRLLTWVTVIFLASWLPRVIALDAFVTPDEHGWLTMSANFWQGVTYQRYGQTVDWPHPGVTTMWAGALGILATVPRFRERAPLRFDPDSEELEVWLMREAGVAPLTVLVAGRWWVVLWVSLALTLAALCLFEPLGPRRVIPAMLLVVWDPFGVALSRQLHVDGLSASLLFLSLVALIRGLWGKQWRFLLLSGVALGLAMLTRLVGVVLLPFGVGLAGSWWLWTRHTPGGWPAWRLLAALGLWAGIASLIVWGLWPALWADPVGTLTSILADIRRYASAGHGDGAFLLGQVVDREGPLYYPLVLLFRLTPVTLLGLGLAGYHGWQRRRQLPPGSVGVASSAALIAFAALFGVAMLLSAKMSERYLLPLFHPLAFVGGLGWVQAARSLWYSGMPGRALVGSGLVGLLVLQGVGLAAQFPYYLTYFNPLVGGSRFAPALFRVGWGEGLERAARWLNQQPAPEHLKVLTWYAYGPVSYYFRGQALPMMEHWNPATWCDLDYVVTYVNQWQRHLPNEAAHHYLNNMEPAARFHVEGLELARIYDMRQAPLPDFGGNDRWGADFGGQIRLLTYTPEVLEVSPGQTLVVTFALQNLAPIEKDLNVLVRLVGADGTEVWRAEGWPWGSPTSTWKQCEVWQDGHELQVPAETPPGEYTLTLSFYDPDGFEPLTVTGVKSGFTLSGTSHVVGTVVVHPR